MLLRAAGFYGSRMIPSNKWRTIGLLALAELLAMGVWFSASAVVPALTTLWNLDDAGRAWLTMSVQIGFVAGALGSAVLNLADRIKSHVLVTTSALLAALSTLLIPLTAAGIAPTLVLRFMTGVFLAGVYPVGMKIVATWTKEDRGFGIGLLVGALTVGSAGPHLLNAFDAPGSWKSVLLLSGSLGAAGGVISGLWVREGPYQANTPRFRWGHVLSIARERSVFLANLGYLGHMWELYAMWVWVPVFLLESFSRSGASPTSARVVAFCVIAAGGVGSIIAGQLADRFGRTTIAATSLVVSGGCSLCAGWLFGASPVVVAIVTLLWGFAVVADSAQFSAAVSELCTPEFKGTALTLQTSLGFLLTMLTIRGIPVLERVAGWGGSFACLAIGPVVGIWAMRRLRRSPEASRLANGKG